MAAPLTKNLKLFSLPTTSSFQTIEVIQGWSENPWKIDDTAISICKLQFTLQLLELNYSDFGRLGTPDGCRKNILQHMSAELTSQTGGFM